MRNLLDRTALPVIVFALSVAALIFAINADRFAWVLVFGFSVMLAGSAITDEYNTYVKERDVAIRASMRRHPAGNALR